MSPTNTNGRRAKGRTKYLVTLVAYLSLAGENNRLTDVKVTSSEPSSLSFTFEALTVVLREPPKPGCGKITQKYKFSSSTSVTAPLFLVLGSPALYFR